MMEGEEEAIEILRREIETQAALLMYREEDSIRQAQEIQALRANIASNVKSIKELAQKVLRREKKIANLKMSLQRMRQAKYKRRRFIWLFVWLVAACLPYGVTCAWKRMAYGFGEEKPLFYYHGFCRRLWRIVKFSLPYGLVRIFSIR